MVGASQALWPFDLAGKLAKAVNDLAEQTRLKAILQGELNNLKAVVDAKAKIIGTLTDQVAKLTGELLVKSETIKSLNGEIQECRKKLAEKCSPENGKFWVLYFFFFISLSFFSIEVENTGA